MGLLYLTSSVICKLLPVHSANETLPCSDFTSLSLNTVYIFVHSCTHVIFVHNCTHVIFVHSCTHVIFVHSCTHVIFLRAPLYRH